MQFYGKHLISNATAEDKEQSLLIKSAFIMALFRYLSEVEQPDENGDAAVLTEDFLKNNIGLDSK